MFYLILAVPFVVLGFLLVMARFETWMLDDEDDAGDPPAPAPIDEESQSIRAS